MKSTKLIFSILFCFFLILPAQAAIFGGGKKKKELAAKEVAEKNRTDSLKRLTTYDKLFAKKSNLIRKEGFITINKVGDKIYFEVPRELFGRELLLSSYINKTSNTELVYAGRSAMAPRRLVLEKTDSLALLTIPNYNIRTSDSSGNINEALKIAQTNGIMYAFPIVATTNDSAALVFDATPLFSINNKDIVKLRGMSVGDDAVVISSADPIIAGLSLIKNIETYPRSVTVSLEGGFKLSLGSKLSGGELVDKPELAIEVNVSLTLLPEEEMVTREADPRIGVQYVKYTSLESGGGMKNGYYAARWKLERTDSVAEQPVYPQKKITLYVDTLFSDTWFAAIRKGIEAWNPLLEEAGFRDAIEVLPYSPDAAFFAGDPLKSCIMFSQTTSADISMRLLTDPRTGEILSVNMSVPRDYAKSVRRMGTFLLADVDERFRNYFLDDGVICEALTANIMQSMGFALGLAPNMAGSAAYSPEQLRSPEFTAKYGITASVTDNVRYNYVALPGDKEKGVELVVKKPGIYDEYAIKWLYKPIAGNEKDTLDSWIKQVKGDARFFYGKEQTLILDPRALANDLSNDLFTATANGITHLKYIARESPAWMKDDNIPQEAYKALFPEYLALLLKDYASRLAYSIGGFYLSEYRDGDIEPSYLPVPRERQKKALEQLLKICDDMSWLDVNHEFVTMGGPNRNNSEFMSYFMEPLKLVFRRLPYVALAEEKTPDAYSCKELLDDLSAYLFSGIASEHPLPAYKLRYIRYYIQRLIQQSETLNANVIAAKNKLNFADADEFDREAMEPMTNIALYQPKDMEHLSYIKLQEARQKLREGKAYCKDQYVRDMYAYYIQLISQALDSVILN